ncbi:MAG: glutamate racemase [Eubacteriales bacterium]|nr:glutamate racemase [Bacillota bacterium]MBV1727118.1 glutamate racemase [Desulforudis sp.]MDQ7789731.1 glutamate racemase [Clostridia bacterium]MDZ4043807.1 glutamate racemase [Eubacteriales bacterium]MBU4532311.1 glutamate racemase [Bacillota bacterium]
MARCTIALFDSGVGGLTVAGRVFEKMPGLPVLYFGDTAHVPYGNRSPEELVRYADNIIRFLSGQGATYIIFACNTSSSLSLEIMRARHDLPMMGLIAPGAKAAVSSTRKGRIGVIATQATVNTGAYEQAICTLSPGTAVYSVAAPRLVPFVEAGLLDAPATEQALSDYLLPLREKEIDTLVLGCTHYPFLRPAISRMLGPDVTLVDPAEATVDAARADMLDRGLLTAGDAGEPCFHRYFVSADALGFMQAARSLLGSGADIDVQEVCLPD